MTNEGKTCPECNESLQGLDPGKHAVRHWGNDPVMYKQISSKGLKRARQLDSKFTVKGEEKRE